MSKHAVQVIGIALIMLVIGFVALWLREPILVPSVASASALQLLTPEEKAAQPWNIAVGQLIGLVAAIVMVRLLGAADAPSFMGHNPLLVSRVGASALAAGITAALQIATKSTCAAGGTLALTVTLGAETPDWAGFARAVAGIALVTLLGELGRRAVLKAKG